MEQNNGGSSLGLILGLVSLIVSIIGGITFGVIGAGVALVAGVIGIILSISTKKATNGEKGTGGLVMSILGIVFAAIFAIGCALCGGAVSSATGGATSAGMCYGYVGVKCFADKVENGLEDVQKQLEDYANDVQNQ